MKNEDKNFKRAFQGKRTRCRHFMRQGEGYTFMTDSYMLLGLCRAGMPRRN
jgi:hypothetical protein